VRLKLTVLAAVSGIAFFVGIFYTLRVDPEIAEANQALHAAKSWRASLDIHPANGAGLWGKIAVVCPDREDLVLTGSQAGHTIRIGDKWWTDGLPTPDKGYTPNPCLFDKEQPILTGSLVAKAMAISAELDRAVRHHARFSSGELRRSDQGSCREWTVDGAYTVCLSLETHLPRDFKAKDGSVTATFTDWNQEITIKPPAP
jgi:hypothetical protein